MSYVPSRDLIFIDLLGEDGRRKYSSEILQIAPHSDELVKHSAFLRDALRKIQFPSLAEFNEKTAFALIFTTPDKRDIQQIEYFPSVRAAADYWFGFKDGIRFLMDDYQDILDKFTVPNGGGCTVLPLNAVIGEQYLVSTDPALSSADLIRENWDRIFLFDVAIEKGDAFGFYEEGYAKRWELDNQKKFVQAQNEELKNLEEEQQKIRNILIVIGGAIALIVLIAVTS